MRNKLHHMLNFHTYQGLFLNSTFRLYLQSPLEGFKFGWTCLTLHHCSSFSVFSFLFLMFISRLNFRLNLSNSIKCYWHFTDILYLSINLEALSSMIVSGSTQEKVVSLYYFKFIYMILGIVFFLTFSSEIFHIYS